MEGKVLVYGVVTGAAGVVIAYAHFAVAWFMDLPGVAALGLAILILSGWLLFLIARRVWSETQPSGWPDLSLLPEEERIRAVVYTCDRCGHEWEEHWAAVAGCKIEACRCEGFRNAVGEKGAPRWKR